MEERLKASPKTADVIAQEKINRAWARFEALDEETRYDRISITSLIRQLYDAELQRYGGKFPDNKPELKLLAQANDFSKASGKEAARRYFLWVGGEYTDFINLLESGYFEAAGIKDVEKPNTEYLRKYRLICFEIAARIM